MQVNKILLTCDRPEQFPSFFVCSFQWNQTTLRWSRVPKAYHFVKILANCAASMLFHCFTVPCIFALRSYMFKNWCFWNKLLPEYSVYKLVSLCVLLDNICLRNTDPMQREWICSFADKQLKYLCSIKDNLYTHTLCVLSPIRHYL